MVTQKETANSKTSLQEDSFIRFEWCWNFKLLIFALVFFPLTLGLGVWQLQRAEQKREILAEHQLRRGAEPVELSSLDTTIDHQYRRVWLEGKPHGEQFFLLDNRMRRGRVGYEVLWPVKVGDQWVLVNRGWVYGGMDRRILPKVPEFESTGNGELKVAGYLYRARGEALVLGEQEAINGWPQVIQQVDMDLLDERFGEAFYPYVLRIDGSTGPVRESVETNEFDASWVIVSVSPAKHIGYAVQWFTMAFALLVLTVIANSNIGEWLRYRRTKKGSG